MEKIWYKSRAKVAGVLIVVVGLIPEITGYFGHRVEIPRGIIEALGGLGVYGIRDAIKKSVEVKEIVKEIRQENGGGLI